MKLIDIIDHTPIPFGYRIAFLTNFFREPLLRQMEKEHGLIRPEWTVLICVKFRGGITATDIREITEQPGNTVSRAIASLQKKNLVRKQVDIDDARRTLLFLTTNGAGQYDAIMKLFQEGERKMTECLSSGELKTLDQLLDKLCRHVPEWRIRSDRYR